MTKRQALSMDQVKVFVLDEADQMLDAGTMSDQCIQAKKCARFLD